MLKRISHSQTLHDFEIWYKARFAKELKEVLHFINRQVFNQIPCISAVSGILIGAWVASNYTTSPVKGLMASLGVMKGGTHVISSGTYKLLSVVLPIVATGVTAYAVQKFLKVWRGLQLELNKERVVRLGKEVQDELVGKLALLDQARENGLISSGEYQTKTANLYQSYSRKCPSMVEGLIIDKLTSKIQ